MEKKKGVSKKIAIIALIIVLLMIGIVTTAYIIYNNRHVEVIEETLKGGKISLTYSDEQNLFMIENASPTSDIAGKVYDSADLFFDFTVKSTLEEASSLSYDLILVKDEAVSTTLEKNIKVYLEKEENGTYISVSGPIIFDANYDNHEFGNTLMKIYSHSRSYSGSDNYRLRMWLSDTSEYDWSQVQNFGVKVAVVGRAK